MGRNYSTVSADRVCPSCGGSLVIALKPESVGETNRVRYRYKFECEDWESCGFESEVYYGPQVSKEGVDAVETARDEAYEKAVVAAKDRGSIQ